MRPRFAVSSQVLVLLGCWSALCALAAGCATSPGTASNAGAPSKEVPRLFGTFDPQPGAWSEYAVTEKDSGKQIRMRMAIVGQEDGGVWYEVINDEQGTRNVIKMLVTGDPNNPDNIRRMIIKSGTAPAAEMPKDFVAMGRKMAIHMFQRRSGVPADPEGELTVRQGEPRTVTVTAGTFEVVPHRILGVNGGVLAFYDFNAEVLPFGVVTSQTDTTDMELLAYGMDAESAIQETPVPMTNPPGMPQGMPRGMPPGMDKPAAARP